MSIRQNLVKAVDYVAAYAGRLERLAKLLDLSVGEVKSFYAEIDEFTRVLARHERAVLGGNALSPYLSMWSPLRGQALYVICRALRPKVVMETGVASGISSAFILEALRVNDGGLLYSIDLPNAPDALLPDGQRTGWIVPRDLHERWRLILGTSQALLGALLDRITPIDIFLHDSDHSFEHMMFEFRLGWQAVAPGGLLVADDISMNLAFDQFSRFVGRKPGKLYHRFGIIRK